ncbi:hypothetical protein CRG98_007772 [Punica granatum]|uniref:Integrase catalytic domain-containing protein n=1 Tax=Punica granatum TaxID=22663 RepID=A0A2I0KU15_PUNGR|nr:hypothetical protein CRG98_007772 [Punica granatum]
MDSNPVFGRGFSCRKPVGQNGVLTAVSQVSRGVSGELRESLVHVYTTHEEPIADALATLASMVSITKENLIEPFKFKIAQGLAHCDVIDAVDANFFLSGETLYRRSFNATLLRCVDENEAQCLMEEVHEGNCGPHMNGLMLVKKLMRFGYFWSTMETDCVKHVRHCHLCQVYVNQIKALSNELHPMAAPWPFSMWGMDTITLASVTAKVVLRFLKRDIIARYGVPATLITDNAKNLNNKLNDELCARFKILHRNSSPYRPQMNVEVEIPSMRVLAESKLKEAEWTKQRYEQLNLINERRLIVFCHGQCYHQRMA